MSNIRKMTDVFSVKKQTMTERGRTVTRKPKSEKTELWKNEVIAAALLMAFAFFINRGIEIKGLYMDDLYLWSCYGEQSFSQFVFPMGSTRFRFLYYLAAWLELAVVGNHIGWFVPANIILNGCIAYTVYRFGKRLSRSYYVGFGCGFLYLMSRMSYYQIGQVYGLMESLALWAAIAILYCAYRYVNDEGDGKKFFIWANVLYFGVCFIHERYIVLLPFLYLALLLKKGKKKKFWWLSPVLVFGIVFLIRILTTGSAAPAGTGGTNVTDTFKVTTAIRYAISQILYVFGVNAGPGHLNGKSWWESPSWVHVSVLAADLVILILVILAIRRLVKDKEGRKRYLKDIVLFVSFIAFCIACSSVTIRVELRWVYVSMTAAYLLMACLFRMVTEKVNPGKIINMKKEARQNEYKKSGWKSAFLCGALILCYAVIMAPVEAYYRGQVENFYYWPNQQRYNTLAEETFEKYGDDIFGKQIYILGNSYEMSDFTARTFFKTFDKERKAEGTVVHHIDTIRDIGLVTNNMIVLREDPGHNAFQDITEFVRNLKCESIYGYYEDGWMDESAKIRVMTGKTGVIHLEIFYPGELTGEELSVISLNGKEVKNLKVNLNSIRTEIKADPNQIAELTFENNFYFKDAGEQRGEKRFSMIVNITTD